MVKTVIYWPRNPKNGLQKGEPKTIQTSLEILILEPEESMLKVWLAT